MKTGRILLDYHDITTQIKPFTLPEKEPVAVKWKDLEVRANNSVFISWLWISNWLELVNDKLFIIECYQGKKLIGLAFFVEKTRKAFGVIPIKQWQLHRTGNTEQDQIWIEHNDFLLDSSVEDAAREQMILAIYDYDISIKEIIVGLANNNVLKTFKKYFYQAREHIVSPGYIVDLNCIENNYSINVLSKNTRSQINRSEKLLAQQGELTFTVISNKNEINQLLSSIAEIHLLRWGNTPDGSGFSNAIFYHFHQNVIKSDDDSIVQISVLSLNDKAIGYLFNYVYKERVSFYLSALMTFDNSKIKVGLTLHARAIQHYFNKDFKYYDFLGGDAQYKQSMSNQRYNLALVSFCKDNLIIRLESKLKDIKQMLKLWLSKTVE